MARVGRRTAALEGCGALLYYVDALPERLGHQLRAMLCLLLRHADRGPADRRSRPGRAIADQTVAVNLLGPARLTTARLPVLLGQSQAAVANVHLHPGVRAEGGRADLLGDQGGPAYLHPGAAPPTAPRADSGD